MIDERTITAIEGSDTDGLVRIVDGLCESRSWEELLVVRSRCEEAVTRGKQLWGVVEFIRYRLALEAPPEWAGPVVSEGPARFTLGPLSEVVAQSNTWADLDPHLPAGPERATVAHERVLRGEDLDDADFDRLLVDLPSRLEPWEPAYVTPTYRSDRVEFATPPMPAFAPVDVWSDRAVEHGAVESLKDLVAHWVDHSEGEVAAVCVEGPAPAAIGTLSDGPIGIASLSAADALAWMAWAASTGAARGRRRGGVAGRFDAWWAVTELTGLDWPPEPDELGTALTDLHWFAWSAATPESGWLLRLAIESPESGRSWALSATDVGPEDDPQTVT